MPFGRKTRSPVGLGPNSGVRVPSGRTLSAETRVQTPSMSLAVWATAPVTRTPPRTNADANPTSVTCLVMAFLPFGGLPPVREFAPGREHVTAFDPIITPAISGDGPIHALSRADGVIE